jgi:hypothetical protein
LKKLKDLLRIGIGQLAGGKWPDSRVTGARKPVRNFEAREVSPSCKSDKPGSAQPQALAVIGRIVAPGKLVHQEGTFETRTGGPAINEDDFFT